MATSSSDFTWDLQRPESSQELLETFDIQAAKRAIAARPRPVEMQSLESPYREYFEDYLQEVKFRRTADWNKIDTTIPAIFGCEGDGKKIPLDGRHRIQKALRDGLTAIPFVRLTSEETEAIRLGPRL